MSRYGRTLGFLAAGLMLAFGRYPVSWLLSSRRRHLPPKRSSSPNSQIISCPSGNRIHVELDGPANAMPMVLLHGLNSSSQQWYYQRLFFKQRYRLVIIDLPGHGRSHSPQQANLSIPVLAADLSYVLGILNIEDPILYGHSMGAMAVMQYCVDGLMPRANAVILQHGSYTDPFKTTPFSPFAQWLERPVVQPFCRFVQRHPLLFRWIGWLNYLNGLSLLFYRFLFFTGGQTPAQLRFMSRIAALNPPEAVAEGLLQCMRFEVSDALNRIDMPALVLSAKHDRLIAPHAATHIASRLSKAQLLEINAGHQSIAEVPEDVNEAINAWIVTRVNLSNYSGSWTTK